MTPIKISLLKTSLATPSGSSFKSPDAKSVTKDRKMHMNPVVLLKRLDVSNTIAKTFVANQQEKKNADVRNSTTRKNTSKTVGVIAGTATPQLFLNNESLTAVSVKEEPDFEFEESIAKIFECSFCDDVGFSSEECLDDHLVNFHRIAKKLTKSPEKIVVNSPNRNSRRSSVKNRSKVLSESNSKEMRHFQLFFYHVGTPDLKRPLN